MNSTFHPQKVKLIFQLPTSTYNQDNSAAAYSYPNASFDNQKAKILSLASAEWTALSEYLPR
jgi:hypothetical protein